MKESLQRIKNDRGQVYPFVLFITMIFISTVLTMVSIYQNELRISHRLWEQMKLESLVQMTESKLQEEIRQAEERGHFTYEFPSGQVRGKLEVEGQSEYYLSLEVTTDGGEVFVIEKFFRSNHE